MIITAHQPNYIPWLGFFQRMDIVDKFIILDNVQFTKKAFIHRNKIKTANGELLLTVPVKVKLDTLIKDVIIDNSQDWQRRHWLSIKQNYKKAPYWDYIGLELKDIYNNKWIKLYNLNIEIIKLIKSKLGIETELIVLSELNHNFGNKTDLLVNLSKYFNASIFFPGIGSKSYIIKDRFEKNNIELIFHEFNHPVYSQLYGPFVSHLSILDLLFNSGPNSLKILRESFNNNIFNNITTNYRIN